MKTILFLHGFFASGSDPIVEALREALYPEYRVIAPDLSVHPMEAIETIRKVIDQENPDLLVGNSCGSFYAQMLAPIVGIPALLGNPCFEMSSFLQNRTGKHQCKYPRQDGTSEIIVDEALVHEFKQVEQRQFLCCSPTYTDKVWGLFGTKDTVAHCRPAFLEHYSTALSFPGSHVPTTDEVKQWYATAAQQMLQRFPKPAVRYFQHFKGMRYKFIRSAYHSESLERMVVYQKQYDDYSFWVRPEQMFFEKVTRDGKTFNRFIEINE